MNFIISIFLVLFLGISSCQREATGDIVPTPAARYGEVDLTFGESGQPWNLPDGTMRVINGRPDNVNIYVRPYKLLSKYPTGKGLGKCSLKNLSSPDLSERETGRGV